MRRNTIRKHDKDSKKQTHGKDKRNKTQREKHDISIIKRNRHTQTIKQNNKIMRQQTTYTYKIHTN